MKITVVDSVMGKGKTNWAIQYMNDSPEQRFMYITPYNKEIRHRVIPGCPTLNFKFAREGSKFESFKQSLINGENVIGTHQVFRMCNEEIRELLAIQGYTLILDEVTSCVEDIHLCPEDVKNVMSRYATADATGKVTWNSVSYPYDGRYYDVKQMADNGNLYLCNDTFFIWLFPCDIFDLFDKVYILTYMFPASLQKYYFDMNDIGYEYKSVIGDNDNGYSLCEHDEQTKGSQLKDLINIYEGKLNNVGNKNKRTGKDNALSATWCDNKDNKDKLKALKRNLHNYFGNIIKSQSDEVMWTTYGKHENELRGKGYINGFVECNCRSTNDFQGRTTLAYCVNRYVRTVLIKGYFRDINVDQDAFGLSEMIQWIWRSAIRNGQQINIYIPSARMRSLLQQYLNDEITLDYSVNNGNLASVEL